MQPDVYAENQTLSSKWFFYNANDSARGFYCHNF